MNPSKIVCVGRNYVSHIKELGNEVAESPVIFIKPPSSLADLNSGIDWNRNLGECHHECELVLMLNKTLKKEKNLEKCLASIGEVSLGLDLTLRDLQTKLKEKGLPWERAKAFDGACLIGEWVKVSEFSNLDQVEFQLEVNGSLKQKGDSRMMIYKIAELLSDISMSFTLEKGDIVMTGTPSGVGPLKSGDELVMILKSDKKEYRWQTFVREEES